jgi:hypothetical protein
LAALRTSGDPGQVWRVGFDDPWQWTPWEYARDNGRFNGRWDDEQSVFRTLYTSESLLGCFLELLAQLRPNTVAFDELAQIDDDAGDAAEHPEPDRGGVGLDWLGGRRFGSAQQRGTYAEVTHAESMGYLVEAGAFDALGIPPSRVDAALLKDPSDRRITRTVARFLFDQYDELRRPVVDGIAFRSRMGDDIRMWAVFERGDAEGSPLLTPEMEPQQVTEENPELLAAFAVLGLHWIE